MYHGILRVIQQKKLHPFNRELLLPVSSIYIRFSYDCFFLQHKLNDEMCISSGNYPGPEV